MDRPLWPSESPEETALLVGLQLGTAKAWDVQDSVDELGLLCSTAGARVVERVICRMARPHPALYIGKGKAEEIAETVRARAITTVVFDENLSPAQGRNLEKIIGTKVVDRTQVILDIFAQHARSREGRMQIELAQLDYLLPRLRHMWTHLERQKGGIGMHGPGEKQLELDRRRILERMVRFRHDLEKVGSHRAEQRRGRRRHGWALVSIVGYTNAGKSTLLNSLTGAQVLAYDKLFATLDPTTRQLKLPNHQQALITDTVGFIRKLPHGLVEAFKATLEEVVQADLLLHVVDAAHPLVEQQISAVEDVLRELGVDDTPVLHVLNKIDLPAGAVRQQQLAGRFPQAVAVSGLRGTGLDQLRAAISDMLRDRSRRVLLRIPQGEGRLLSSLRTAGTIFEEKYEGDFVVLDVAVPPRLWGRCEPYAAEPDTPE